ncbi:LOW QUALITY PROTEIN: hypothetical protein ACHAXN_002117 [Cyclotella atomus]
MGFRACKADPDLWLKEQTDKKGKRAYILYYVDDLLVIHHNPKKVLDRINKYLPLKEDSVGLPEFYLGAKLKKKEFADKTTARAYLKDKLNGNYSLPKRVENPFPYDYSPDEDVSLLLDVSTATYYMQLIGILRWMCKLGRLDICCETSMLSSYSAMAREGHFKAMLHVMGYLKAHSNSRLIFDPEKPNVENCGFREYSSLDWGAEYDGAEELIPVDAPKALGKSVLLRMFIVTTQGTKRVDALEQVLSSLSMEALLIGFRKSNQPLKPRCSAPKFCALKHCIENLRGIRYKLRMLGVPIGGATRIFGDNMSIVTNSSKPESTLKKKSNSVCYHAVREAVVMGEAPHWYHL